MNFSPELSHQFLWFVLAFLKVLILSSGVGFIFYKVAMNFHGAWKARNRIKIWLYLSLACFGLHVLLIGIK